MRRNPVNHKAVVRLISIHAPLAGCDPLSRSICPYASRFQSTHPLRGATKGRRGAADHLQISIHAPLAGCDFGTIELGGTGRFQSTHPLRGATGRPARLTPRAAFQSTHPLRGATLEDILLQNIAKLFQSTHPLRGATPNCRPSRKTQRDFNPRTPCGVRRLPELCDIPGENFNPRTPCGVRLGYITHRAKDLVFQSTHPLRGATQDWLAMGGGGEFQSTHPLRGATWKNNGRSKAKTFQSTHPLRGATVTTFIMHKVSGISIHAPLAGCDAAGGDSTHTRPLFQSTHPLRGATCSIYGICRIYVFQSTHPLRGATIRDARCPAGGTISIHAPLAGCDSTTPKMIAYVAEFQSTHPLRGATLSRAESCTSLPFQSTHPLRGATAKTYKENCTFFELADKLSARIAAKKPSAKADRCA